MAQSVQDKSDERDDFVRHFKHGGLQFFSWMAMKEMFEEINYYV